ncbi:MAG: hypothetical protein ACLQVX_19110 [Limisphaerales bacterium]
MQSDAELKQAQGQLLMMQEALRSLLKDVLPKNKRNFAILAEGPLEEIRRLQAEINAYTGADLAIEYESPIWLRLFGPGAYWPSAPTSLLTTYLEAFRKGIQTMAEFLQHGEITGARPERELKEACDLEIVAFQPGSIRIGLRLPEVRTEEADSAKRSNAAERALSELLDTAAWAGSQQSHEELETKLTDPTKRRVVLNALKPLLPRQRGQVECVELSGWRVEQRGLIRLTRDTNTKLDAAIDRTVSERMETFEGELREVDLDELRFTLRDPARMLEVRCVFEEDFLEQAKSALDQRIRVTGIRKVGVTKRSSVLQVTRLEVLEGEGPVTPQN